MASSCILLTKCMYNLCHHQQPTNMTYLSPAVNPHLHIIITQSPSVCYTSLFLGLYMLWVWENIHVSIRMGFPGGSFGKESASNSGDPGSISRLRSPGKGHDNPFQYSCLENPIDRGAWRATVHGVRKSWTPLSD